MNWNNMIKLNWFEKENYWFEKLFKQYPIMENYKDYLENLSNLKVLWAWRYWIVIKDEVEWRVMKFTLWTFDEESYWLSKTWNIVNLSIKKEQEIHDRFYRALNYWKEQWKISDSIHIPRIRDRTKNNDMYSMELIKWKSLYFWSLYEQHEKHLIWLSVDNLTEHELENFLVKNCWLQIELHKQDAVKFLEKRDPKKAEELRIAKKYLKEAWLEHHDLHIWNVMIDSNWDLYIIDFWRIVENPQRSLYKTIFNSK